MNENMKKVLYVLVGILSIGIVVLILLKTNKNDIKTYTVKFDTDGGTEVVSQTVIAGSIATKPTDPTKEGFTFDSWLYENETYNFNASVNKDITLIAKWVEEISTEKLNVNFDSNGGTSVDAISIDKDESVTKPTDPTKEGYTFKYWSLNGSEYDFSSKVTENITLTAVWEENAPTKTGYYQVTFDTDGGNTIEAKEVKSGSKVSKPSNPTKSGYVFLDWYLNGKIYSFSTKVTSNITLTALWAKEGKYTITFDTDGGSSIANQTISAGKLVSKPTDPTKENMMFKEWQLDGVKYDFNTKVKEDMTLKAVWKTPEYTVTFDTDGGTTIKSQTIKINKTATKPTDPTKTGYTFTGWYVGETEYKFTEKVTADITLKAKWTALEYTVTFDSNGGSDVASKTVSYGNTVSQPANPTKEGYTFSAWQLNGTNYNFSTKVTGNITLKATWTKDSAKTYTFKLKNIDNLGTSPDVELSIYENGTKVTYTKLMYTNGKSIPFSSKYTVSKADVEGETTLKAVVSGATITATLSN